MKLAVGLLLMLISIAHVLYSKRKQVAVLRSLAGDAVLIGSVRVMSLQGGLLL